MAEHFDLLKEQHQFHKGRFFLLVTVIFFTYFILMIRLVDITIFQHDFLFEKRQKRFVIQEKRSGQRQRIMDTHNFALATTMKTFSIGWQPSYYQQLKMIDHLWLAELLEYDFEKLNELLQCSKKFLYLKRKIELTPQQSLNLKRIKGILIIPEDKRFYPLQEATAQLIGFLNIENQGVEGVEATFNNVLQGAPLLNKKTKDLKGRVLAFEKGLSPPQQSLELSIDSRLQAILYQELKKHYQLNQMESLSALLIDAQTTSLLAVTSYPSFNANALQGYSPAWRLKPFLDSYEPGSILKPFSIACVLAHDKTSLNNFHAKTHPGYLLLDGHKITDVTKKNELNLTDILLYSSNIGLTKLLHQYPECDLQGFLKKFGFDQQTGIELHNESYPYYPSLVKKGSFVEATLAFGYGLQVNLGQVARAYTVFTQNGRLKPISLLKNRSDKEELGIQVLDSEITDILKKILTEVIEIGSGKAAYLKDYPMAGKTGTVQRVGLHGYEQRYHAFFVVFFPVDQPRYVLIIHADDPRGKIYGGQICAPLAKELIPKILAISQVPSYAKELSWE